MPQTTKLGLELLQNGSANQTLGNTTFAQLNQLVQAGVVDKDLSTPPVSPVNEALYIVASGNWGTGSSKAGQLTYWLDSTGVWQFIVPREGMLVHVNDEDTFYKYDGSAWVVFSAGGGAVTSVNGQAGAVLIAQPNLLVNGDFALNQRGFPGGALAAGGYGFDRWGAYNGGANVSVSGGVVTLASGAICQVIEDAGLTNVTVTVSLENPSATITVTLGNGTGADSVSGTITAGSGRRGITLTVPATITGNLKVRLSVAASTTFSKVKAEAGSVATPWRRTPPAAEVSECQRYFQKSYDLATAPGSLGLYNGAVDYFAPSATTAQINYTIVYMTTMRAAPAATIFNPVTGESGKMQRGVTGSFSSVTANTFAVGQSSMNVVAPAGVNANEIFFHWVLDAELTCTD